MLHQSFRAYAVILAAAWSILGAVAFGDFLVLHHTHETWTGREMAEQQAEKGGLYGSLTRQLGAFKYDMIERVKPELVVIGTSRAIRFRDYLFLPRAYMLGNGAQMMSQIRQHVSEMLARHKPAVLVVTVDYWNFVVDSGNENLPEARRTIVIPPGRLHVNRLFLPAYFVWTGEMSAGQWLSLAAGAVRDSDDGVPLIGIQAVLKHLGFMPDGSVVEPKPVPIAHRFDEQLSQIRGQRAAAEMYARHRRVWGSAVEDMASLVRETEAMGIKMIVIAPPMAPSIVSAIENAEGYGYVGEWRRAMARTVPNFIDLHDPRDYGAPDCEFFDANHGGEVAYARMLIEAARRRPDLMRGVVDPARLGAFVQANAGRIFVADSPTGRRLFGARLRAGDFDCR